MPCSLRGFRPCARAGRGLIARDGGAWPSVVVEGGMGAASESLSEVLSLEVESDESDESDEFPFIDEEEDSEDDQDPRARVLSVLELEDLFIRAAPPLSSK